MTFGARNLALMDSVSRREFIARLGLGVGAGLLGACRDSTGSSRPGPTSSGLEHVIVVTMENRSYDHLLGWLPRSDGKQAGLSYLDRNDTRRDTHHLTQFHGCGFADPAHSFAGGRVEYNDGACDGWLRAEGNDIFAIGYYEAADLPFLGRAAPHWTVLDRYFTPFMGPTGPNRIISQAGQTDRLSNTPTASTLPTIWDRLASAGVTGKNYGYPPVVTAALFGNRFSSLIQPMASFFTDAAANTLPNVAFVDPEYVSNYTNSYHPPADIRDGEAFLSSVYKAITTSPAWSSTVLIVTFDEWGGFFDHVPPPVAPIPEIERGLGNTDGLRGFRIPTLLISPFARRQYVASTVYDHASVLRLIEWRWGLSPLTVRDENANNLADELDFTHPQMSAPVIDMAAGPYAKGCP